MGARPASGTMPETGQLALDLRHRPALGREDFVVGPGNEEAVAWVDAWPNWPGRSPGLSLHGPTGAGKTHLAAVWAVRSGARSVDVASLAVEGVPAALGDTKAVVLDRVEAASDGQALLHLFNLMVERAGSLLFVSRVPLSRLSLAPADLRSRLLALPSVGITRPDDGVLAAVMGKLFRDRQLSVDGRVIDYLVARMDRSFGAARDLVEAVDRVALEGRRPITVALAREVLDARESRRDKTTSPSG